MKFVIFRERFFSDTHFIIELFKKVMVMGKMSKKWWFSRQNVPKMLNFMEYFSLLSLQIFFFFARGNFVPHRLHLVVTKYRTLHTSKIKGRFYLYFLLALTWAYCTDAVYYTIYVGVNKVWLIKSHHTSIECNLLHYSHKIALHICMIMEKRGRRKMGLLG